MYTHRRTRQLTVVSYRGETQLTTSQLRLVLIHQHVVVHVLEAEWSRRDGAASSCSWRLDLQSRHRTIRHSLTAAAQRRARAPVLAGILCQLAAIVEGHAVVANAMLRVECEFGVRKRDEIWRLDGMEIALSVRLMPTFDIHYLACTSHAAQLAAAHTTLSRSGTSALVMTPPPRPESKSRGGSV